MQIFYEIVELLGSLLSYLFILYTTSIFYSYKGKQYKRLSLILSIAYIPLTYDLITPFSNTIASLLAMVFVYIVISICFNGNLGIKAFIVLVYNIFSVCVSNLYFSLFSFLFQVTINELIAERNALRVSLILSLYLFEIIILFIIEKIAKHNFVANYNLLELSITFLFLLIDFAFSVFSFIILFYYSNSISIIKVVCCSMSILCVIYAFVALYLIKKLKEQYLHSLDSIAIKMQLDNMGEYIKNSKKTNAEVRALRHDIKNKLLAYNALLEHHNIDDVICDIKETLSLPSLIEPLAYCSNTAFNILIFNKAKIAKESDIAFHCKIIISPEYTNLKLMVALSNLIDNAIEHERKEPKNFRNINLSLIQDIDSINIILENYISDSILKNNPSLTTTKVDAIQHGFGINNIRELVSSIDGMIEFYEEDSSFFVQVIIT